MDSIKVIIDNIEGWLTSAEGSLLYDKARNCSGRGVIVEIGSWKGKSTICLAKGSLAGARIPVFSVDPHTGSGEYPLDYGINTFKEFQENIRKTGVEDVVRPIVKTSVEAAIDFKEPIELLFIDGSHEYESVKKDFELWSPKLVEGGTIIFHDSVLLPGVAKVVKNSIYYSTNFRQIGFVHSSTYAQKVSRNVFVDRLRNRSVLLLKNIYMLSIKIYIPPLLKSAMGNIIRSIINR